MIDHIPIAVIETIPIEDINLPIAVEISYPYIEIVIPEQTHRSYVHQELSLDPLICHCWCCVISIICFILIIYILIGIKIIVS